ncbi:MULTISPECIES: hypothetical protein [unclassified Streptomyces]|uniref:hypothetical protein n=1 Tax=unclassified Streptomyces TaxID=2593676 RepID=UPI001BE8BEB7|nr:MULTISPECIES: hypothetical protein [unclassified Streptomyces]MBT2405036.1 hypothetical protein [Streptomyces sp. ISL-21]MBT2456992.1 hypothetical protein [Streptomyces sp. ISL-86]MBT2610762.1 hypothetical protein [Streptomyces sp. ISL-87]
MDPVTAVAAAGVALVAQGALQSVGEEAARSGWNSGVRLVERIRARFRGDTQAEGALDRVAQAPDDEDALQELERRLAAYMLQDRAFEAEMRQLVDKAVSSQGRGAQVNAAMIKNVQVFNEKVEVQGDWNMS